VDLSANDSSSQFQLGAKVVSNDGREFVYALAGGATLVVGNVLQGPAEVANHQNLAPVANTAAGSTTLNVTLGNTAATASQYAGGWAIVAVTPGLGQQLKIKSHPAAAGNGTLLLQLEDPVATAVTLAASKIDLVANPYSGVIQSLASASGPVVGVAVKAITNAQYGWIQTRGVANVLNEGGVTAGQMCVVSNATAGAFEAGADATDPQGVIGAAVSAVTTAECGPVNLTL